MTARRSVPRLPVQGKIGGFDEVELCITEEQAVMEAKRCLRCDLQTEDGKKWLEEQEGRNEE